MYYDFFGFREPPFSIAPDPRYLYLSDRHKEALAHLMYGIQGQGGFIVITGEVGTGKTTISRCFIENVPDHVDIALILNPRLSARELLSSICDELEIRHPAGSSIKRLVDLINEDLLKSHAAGRHKVLMIDEAQNLSADVLEQLRLLTNLETAEKKLLQIVLLGQPELQELLAKPELRQLNQRVTARYHLDSLDKEELPAYIRYRLSVAGQRSEIFSDASIRALYKASAGIPRVINLIADRALLGAYAEGEYHVTPAHIRAAAREVSGSLPRRTYTFAGLSGLRAGYLALVTGLLIVAILALWLVDLWPGGGNVEWPEPAEVTEQVEHPDEIVPDEPAVPDTEAQGTPVTIPPIVAQPEPAVEPAVEPMPEEAFPPVADPWGLATSEEQAFAGLFTVWGQPYQPDSGKAVCRFAVANGLGCLKRQGTRRSLEQIDRPTVLELSDDSGSVKYLALLQLDGTTAVVAGPEGEVRLPFAMVEEYWFGFFSVLWRMPPYMTGEGIYGGSNGEQLWLSARLMELADELTTDRTDSSRIKSMSVPEQVRWYQEQKGLSVDGIAGAMTLIQISNDLDPSVPRLVAPMARAQVQVVPADTAPVVGEESVN